MKAYTLRIFGITVLQFDVVDLDLVPVEEAEPEEAEDENTSTEIGGGATQNFEFDEAPYAPEDLYAEEYLDDRRVKLGFQPTRKPKPDVPGIR